MKDAGLDRPRGKAILRGYAKEIAKCAARYAESAA